METPAAAMCASKGRDCLASSITLRPRDDHPFRYYPADEFFEIHGSRGIIWVTRCTGEMLDLPAVVVIRGGETVCYQVPADWRLGFDGAAVDFIDGLLRRAPAGAGRQARSTSSRCAGDSTSWRSALRDVLAGPGGRVCT